MIENCVPYFLKTLFTFVILFIVVVWQKYTFCCFERDWQWLYSIIIIMMWRVRNTFSEIHPRSWQKTKKDEKASIWYWSWIKSWIKENKGTRDFNLDIFSVSLQILTVNIPWNKIKVNIKGKNKEPREILKLKLVYGWYWCQSTEFGNIWRWSIFFIQMNIQMEIWHEKYWLKSSLY